MTTSRDRLLELITDLAVVHGRVTGTGEGATMLAYALTLPLVPPALALLDEDESRSEPDSSPFETPNRRAPWRASFVPHSFGDARDSPSHHVAAAQRAGDAEGDEAAGDASVDWDAGTQTLKSIFPHAEDSVLLLILQECGGNVEMAIDRLLEMT